MTPRASAVLLLLLASCAISESAYQKRALEVSERNDKRFAEAVADLKRRGYVLLDRDDAILYASLDPADGKRCLAKMWHVDDPDGKPLAPDEPLRIVIGEGTRAGEQPKPPLHVTAPAEAACTFFRQAQRSAGELEVKKEDGQTARIVHSRPRTLARAANGEIVRVEVQSKVTRTSTVKIDRTCNRSPTVEPDPLEHPFGVPVLWAPVPPLRTVAMTVEREELDTTCTDYVE